MINKKIDNAIKKVQAQLIIHQREDGSIFGDVDFDIWANAAYLLLIDYLGVKHEKKECLVNWIIKNQNMDGSWGDITEPSSGNYRNTLMGLASAREYMSKEAVNKAENWLKNYSGNKWLDPYTEMFLSIKEKIKINGPPIITSYIPEWFGRMMGKFHMKFPKKFKWSIYLFPSAWTRNSFPPLLILSTLKNNKKLGFLSKMAVKKTEKKMLESQLEDGSWFGTALPTMGSIYALMELGFPISCEQIQKGLMFCRELVGKEGNPNRFRLKVWDTSLAMLALSEIGTQNNDVIKKAEKFLISAQTQSGGWAFGLNNKGFPDNDDTALALLALEKSQLKNKNLYIKKGIEFLLKMQNDDGGFGAFDKNQSRKRPGFLLPYHEEYGHELKDPSTADVTAHVLQALGTVSEFTKTSKRIKKAINWLKTDQLNCGAWWGRWGVAYIYGTTQVLRSLKAIGENMYEAYVIKAINWLKNAQNSDGGWGEHYSSYYSENPILGKSTVEQTSWALICLMDCGLAYDSQIIKKGIDFLLNKQERNGKFPNSYTAAAIDPGRYTIYSLVFPLMALARFKKIEYENDRDKL